MASVRSPEDVRCPLTKAQARTVEEVIEKYRPRIAGVVGNKGLRAADADDAIQNFSLRVMQGIQRWNTPDGPGEGWCVREATRAVYDVVRRRRFRNRLLKNYANSGMVRPDIAADSGDQEADDVMAGAVEAALRRLPPKWREVVESKRDGSPYWKIAAKLRINETTASRWFAKAIEWLEAELAPVRDQLLD
jgi:RNA polymerase sigma factor (sigma-70 family)